MITYNDIATQVAASLTDFVNDFDVDGIVRDLIDKYGLVNIDDPSIDEDAYWALVEKHEKHAR